MGAALIHSLQIMIILSLLLVSACGGSGGSTTETSSTSSNNETANNTIENNKVDPLDSKNIAESIYLSHRVPEDFYHEPERDRSNFYSISHIKSNDITNTDTTNTPYELCSQEFTQALEWSEQEASGQSNYLDLVDNSETDIFYEFTRVNSNTPNQIYLNRIFKCNIFNKASTIESLDDSIIGTISPEEINASNIKNLIDYLWSISPHNNFGYSVLSTDIAQNADHYTYNMYEAKISFYGDSGSCDTIEVDKISYSVDQATGLISISQQTVKTISATVENNTYRICE